MRNLGVVAARTLAVLAAFRAIGFLTSLPALVAYSRVAAPSGGWFTNPSVTGGIAGVVLMILASAVLWANAGQFAPRNESDASIDPAAADLRRLAFAVLGAYLALSSVGDVISHLMSLFGRRGAYWSETFSYLTGSGIQLIAGAGIYLANRKRPEASMKDVLNWPRSGEE